MLGASEGIGRAFARELAAEGLQLVLVARRQEPLEALCRELGAEALSLDLGGDIEAALRELAATREVGLVVYNAAYSIVGPFLETSLQDKQRIIDVNVRGPLVAAHVFGERMQQRGRGGIVLLSSLTAFWGSPWVATYGATKAFNLSLGEALAKELDKVDVVVSCAGATRTPGFLASIRGMKGPASMSPEAVARQTLRALRRRGVFVPGLLNRVAQFVLTRFVPRRWAVGIMASETKKLRRSAAQGSQS